MSNIEIFKTNVRTDNEAEKILKSLLKLYTSYTMNFDLEDKENILRVLSLRLDIETDSIISHLNALGYNCDLINHS